MFCIWGPIMCKLKGATPQEGINRWQRGDRAWHGGQMGRRRPLWVQSLFCCRAIRPRADGLGSLIRERQRGPHASLLGWPAEGHQGEVGLEEMYKSPCRNGWSWSERRRIPRGLRTVQKFSVSDLLSRIRKCPPSLHRKWTSLDAKCMNWHLTLFRGKREMYLSEVWLLVAVDDLTRAVSVHITVASPPHTQWTPQASGAQSNRKCCEK